MRRCRAADAGIANAAAHRRAESRIAFIRVSTQSVSHPSTTQWPVIRITFYSVAIYTVYSNAIMMGMDTRMQLIEAALELIEENGLAGFSTRLACDRVGVTAPTLYHHFGDADGLVSAAVSLGHEQFLQRKKAQPRHRDPVRDVLIGWDDYVAFARERPRLYAAMTARLMEGRRIEAARASRLHLEEKLERLVRLRPAALPVRVLADIMWATAHAASLLQVASGPRGAAPEAIAALRETALRALTATQHKARGTS